MQLPEGPLLYAGLVGAGFFLAVLLYLIIFRPGMLRKQEKRLVERKDQFIALGSHYLLTPITIIQTAIARLQSEDGDLTAEQRKQLYETIELGQQRLWIIAEQLVLVNQIDFHELRLRAEVGDLSDTISNAIADMDVFARSKHLKVRFEDLTQDIHQARFDVRRMRQVFVAVLDNAIKFSMDGGEIVVRLTLEGNIFVITVEDHGIGMPPGIIEHITEKFYRGNDIYNFDYEGLGLGLYIANSIVSAHQGTIRFDAQPKKGTTTVIEFPNI